MRTTRLLRLAAITIGIAGAVSMGACGGTPDNPRWSISGTVSGAVSQGVTMSLTDASNATTATDTAGHYSFSGLSNGAYTVTPSLTGFTFNPASRSVTLSGADIVGQDFTATALPHLISGTVSGAVSQGVAVTLGGTSRASATTDTSGHYFFSGLSNGNYTVTPSLTGFTFTPANLPVTVSGADVISQDFTATALPHLISGTVSGAVSQGVTLSLTGASNATTATDAAGHYSFSGLSNGAYTVTPSLTGFTFTPASRPVTVSGADVIGQDFTATAVPHVISGTVSGAVSQGVAVTLGGTSRASATTDVSGHYSFSGLANGSYTLTPSLTGFTFNPADRSVTLSGADVVGQDFTATVVQPGSHTIWGAVFGAVMKGVTVTLGGASSATRTTDSSGLYSFSGLANGSYTLTPSLTGFTFDPASRSVTVNGADVGGQSFSATRLFCTPELTECSGICVDTQNDTENCGGCGSHCNLPHANAICSSGTCKIGTCASGWLNCDGLDANGCEQPSMCNRCCPKGLVCTRVCYPTVGCHMECAPRSYGG